MRVSRIPRAAGWALALVLALAPGPSAAGSLTIVRDVEIEEHIRAIADPLLAAAGLVPREVDLYLVKDERLNAFVAGGQNLFLHSGLLLATTSPEQLAGVIAHEVGHIAGGHLSRQVAAREKAVGQMLLGTVLGLAAAAAGPATMLALTTALQAIEGWNAEQMITGAVVPGSATKTGCQVQVMVSRGTLLLTTGPFQKAGANVAITVRALGI